MPQPASTQPPKPNYNLNFSSVIGGREERGIRGPGFGRLIKVELVWSPCCIIPICGSCCHGTFPTISQSNVQSRGLIFTTGPKPKVKEDDFEELLSTQGFASRPDKKGPRTIAEMRREEMTKEIDPLKLQVLDFKY